MSKILLCGLAAGLGILSACKKAPAPETGAEKPAAPAAVSVSAEPATDAPPPPAAPAAVENAGPTDPTAAPSTSVNPSNDEVKITEDLQAALSAYYLANVGTPAPKTLDELVKKGFIKRIPTAPPGKKIVYRPENWLVTIENAGP